MATRYRTLLQRSKSPDTGSWEERELNLLCPPARGSSRGSTNSPPFLSVLPSRDHGVPLGRASRGLFSTYRLNLLQTKALVLLSSESWRGKTRNSSRGIYKLLTVQHFLWGNRDHMTILACMSSDNPDNAEEKGCVFVLAPSMTIGGVGSLVTQRWENRFSLSHLRKATPLWCRRKR